MELENILLKHSAYRIGWCLQRKPLAVPWNQELRLPKTVNTSKSTPFRTAENAWEDVRMMQGVRSRTLLLSAPMCHTGVMNENSDWMFRNGPSSTTFQIPEKAEP